MSFGLRPFIYAVSLNVVIAMLLFIAVKAWLRPPLEEVLGVAVLLVPAALHFLVWPQLSLGMKLCTSAASLTLSIFAMLAAAMIVFGDAL